MVERRGKVAAVVTPNVQAKTVVPHITQRVLPRTTIYTDELASYNRLGNMGYQHRRIHHAQQVYVMGNVHTNTIEGFSRS